MKKRPKTDRRQHTYKQNSEKDRRMYQRRKDPWFTRQEIKEFLPSILLAMMVGLFLWALMENSDLREKLDACIEVVRAIDP